MPEPVNNNVQTKITLAVLAERMQRQDDERALLRLEFKEFRQEFRDWSKEHGEQHGGFTERLARCEEKVNRAHWIFGTIQGLITAALAYLGIAH